MTKPVAVPSLVRRLALAMIGLAALAPLLASGQKSAAPYVPTPSGIVDQMLNLAEVRADDFLIDLGSGDGRIVITAAQRFGARGFGVDINPDLVKSANQNAAKAGVADHVRFEQRDLFATGLSEATVLTLYLLPGSVTQLVPKILEQMRPGARVVSHDYPLAPWPPERRLVFDVPEKVHISGTTRTVLYLYTVPARIGGEWRLELPEPLARSPVRLAIKQELLRLSGDAIVAGRSTPLEQLGVHGEQVAFAVSGLSESARPVQFTGTARDDTMEGAVMLPGGAVPWRAIRVTVPLPAGSKPE